MAKNAQKLKMGSRGNAKCSVSFQATRVKMHPPNVPGAGLQKCRANPGSYHQPFRRYGRFSSKIKIFRRFQKVFFASISTPRPVRETSPPINPNHLSIYTRMASFRKIVWKFSEISSKIAYNRYSMGGRLLRARSGPLPPPRMIKISQKETAT